MTGVVKWFNNNKGFGFILFEDKEAFVHYSQIIMNGYKTLSENEPVEIGSIIETDKGYQAQAVKKINLL